MAHENYANKNFNKLLEKTDLKIELLGKIFFLIPLIYLSFPYFLQKNPWTLFDSADLLIHETGHLVFFFGGQFLSVLGGSVFQLLIPIIFLIYFYFKKSIYSSFFCVFWLGINLIYVAIYMADANAMVLPLLVGGSIHDWNYLFKKVELLELAENIGWAVRGLGIIFILVGFIGMSLNILLIIKKFVNK